MRLVDTRIRDFETSCKSKSQASGKMKRLQSFVSSAAAVGLQADSAHPRYTHRVRTAVIHQAKFCRAVTILCYCEEQQTI